MLFWIEVSGMRVAVQAVNRKPNPYWRLAPYTLVYPTPKQREVRYTTALAAHSRAGEPLTEINRTVKEAFTDWQKTERPPNRVAEGLKALYGDQADQVLSYIAKRNIVSEKLKNPEEHARITEQVVKLLEAEA